MSPFSLSPLSPLSYSSWIEKALSSHYDGRNAPAAEKHGISIGMSMTEKQGGSDVRANTTRADPQPQGHYFLHGHKWFTSAPMSDVFLTLAQTENGISCFLVPRWVPSTGEFNRGLRFQRLKDKLGDRSNASSEVEYHGAYAELLGQEGRGIATILSMVQHTRLDCLVGSAGLMRRCLSEAVHNAHSRFAFGKRLLDMPLMRAVIADLALECEASTALAFRVASCFDAQTALDVRGAADAAEEKTLAGPTVAQEAALGRIATAIAKYHLCKRAPQVAYECMESLGGNGVLV